MNDERPTWIGPPIEFEVQFNPPPVQEGAIVTVIFGDTRRDFRAVKVWLDEFGDWTARFEAVESDEE